MRQVMYRSAPRVFPLELINREFRRVITKVQAGRTPIPRLENVKWDCGNERMDGE